MDALNCSICDQDFSSQVSLDKHIVTNKHKTNEKINILEEENNTLKSEKNALSNELAETYDIMEDMKIEITNDQVNLNLMEKKLQEALARIEEINKMVKCDIEAINERNSKNIDDLKKEIDKLNNTKLNNMNKNYILCTGIGMGLITLFLRGYTR